MGYKKGQDRRQVTLLPDVLDDYVQTGSYVRFIDEFVESFDLVALNFKYAVPAETGRPPYDPKDLLKLYIYGSMNRLNSTRQLMAACRTNVEVMWLLRKLQPDFRTISEFRRHNGQGLRKLFRQFIKRLRGMGLVVGEMIGIDGSKFAASNSKDNNYSEAKLNRLIAIYKGRAKTYLERLNRNDSNDAESFELKEQLQQQLDLIQKRCQEKEKILENLKKSGQRQISTVDPDSKRMKSGDGTVVGFNVQASVDAKNKIIIDVEVTNSGTDSHELGKMTERAKEILEKDHIKAAADTGYYDSQEILNCEKNGVETYVSKPKSRKTNFFSKDDFSYQRDGNFYICPAGEKLNCRGQIREHGRILLRYQTAACTTCLLRSQCTSRIKGSRRITRFLDEDQLEIIHKRVENAPEIRTLRKALVEHPFGTLKRRTGGRFLTKRLLNVSTEAVLMVLGYNLTRVFNIVGSDFRSKILSWKTFFLRYFRLTRSMMPKQAVLINPLNNPSAWSLKSVF